MTEHLDTSEYETTIQSIKKSLSAVVLIHIFDDHKKDSKKIYNAALCREGHNHYVISGAIVSPDGHVVTTANTFPQDYSKIIVSVNSEKRKNTVAAYMIITIHDYEATVVKIIPELNVAILKIQNPRNVRFNYLKFSRRTLAYPAESVNQTEMFFALGKAVGKDFVRQQKTYNTFNYFAVCAYPVERILVEKINGVKFLIAQNKIAESSIFPENAGGPLINCRGKMLGILDYPKSLNSLFLRNVVIPTTVIEKAIKFAITPSVNRLPKFLDGCHFINTRQAASALKDIETYKFCIQKNGDVIGVYVESIVKDSAADQYGIVPGDVITKLNGEVIENVIAMKNMLNRSICAGSVVFTIIRDKKIIEVECFL
jgi:S1-C subfamily serine protease